MARRNSKRQSNQMQYGQQAGGFTPVSYHHNPQKGAYSAMESANQYSRSNVNYASYKRKSSRGKKAAIIAVFVVALLAVGGIGAYAYAQYKMAEVNENLHSVSEEEMKAIDNELTGMTKFDEPFTVLLLGSDAREDDPDMGARTDTIIVTRVDPTNNVVSMVSIPRDTMVSLDGAGTQKINAAYTYGGPSGTIAAVKDLCGVDIDHYAELNFEGLVGLVDAIGGIDIYATEEVDDWKAGDAYIPEGEQHLDGDAALTYARSRQYADGDFTRVKHQRQVIEAIVHRGLETPASELYGLISVSTDFLTTDSAMDVDFIFSLADQMRHNDKKFTLYSATIPATTAMVDGISYVIADTAGTAEMMKILMSGGDVSKGVTTSSISSDLDAIGGTDTGEWTSIAAEVTEVDSYSYSEEPTYYEEVPAAPAQTAETGGTDAGGAGAGGVATGGDTGGGDAGGGDAGGAGDGGGDAGGGDAGGGDAGGGEAVGGGEG